MRSMLLLFLMWSASAAMAQRALPDRGGALVATAGAFAFYSDPVTNLHDFLVWNARSREPVEPAPACVSTLPAEQRAAFEHAREHYKVFGTPSGDRLLLALRFRLAGFGDFGLADAAAIEATLAELPPAAPAYEKCWWTAHDARNRRWIAALEPLLAAHEEALSERLRELYGAALGRPLPVDVVSYGSFSGADSSVDPDHLLISSVAPSNQGYAALEVVFHEASHTVFGPGTHGPLWTELDAAAKAAGAPLPPNFWHAMLFYTTGTAVEARLAGRGIDYEQFLYSQSLFARSWPAYRLSLERIWQPYLDGRVAMAEAVQQLVAAPKLSDRGAALVATTRSFALYSDLLANLHDFLVWNARSREPVEPASACLAGLPADQRAAFEHARDYYEKTFANGAGDLILISMHWQLANLGDIRIVDSAVIAATFAELAPATHAYENCWWREHDARNRRWIASVLPLIAAHEDDLRVRLAALYGHEFPAVLPVDVVGYAGVDGGDTVLNPHHVDISSARASNAGYSGLEMLFQQASHALFGLRAGGAVWTALQEASTSAARPVPEDFSRLLLFLTTGMAVQMRLTAQGVQDYEPYVYRSGWFERSPPAHREALERIWLPYVGGRLPMADAATQLVESLPAAAR